MKHIGPLLIILLFFPLLCTAQAEDPQMKDTDYDLKKNKIFFRAAFSTPRGDYEATEGNDNSGFADDGRNLELGYEYRINENIGLVFRYSNLRHGLQSSSFATELDKQLKASLPQENFRTTVTFDDYRINSFLISPRLYNEIGNNTYLVITPTFGYSSFVVGELRANTVFQGGPTLITTQYETSAEVALMYGAAGGLSFRANSDVSINLFVEYLEAKYTGILASGRVEAVGQGNNSANNSAATPVVFYDQKVQVLNFGIEIGYNF